MADSISHSSSIIGSVQNLGETSGNHAPNHPEQETKPDEGEQPGNGEAGQAGHAGQASSSNNRLRNIWSSLGHSSASAPESGPRKYKSEIASFLDAHPGEFPVDIDDHGVGIDLPGWDTRQSRKYRLLKGNRHRIHVSRMRDPTGRYSDVHSFNDDESSSDSSDEDWDDPPDDEVMRLMRQRKKEKREQERKKREAKNGRGVFSSLGSSLKKSMGLKQKDDDDDETPTTTPPAPATGSAQNPHPRQSNREVRRSGAACIRSSSATGQSNRKDGFPETGSLQFLRDEHLRRRRMSMPVATSTAAVIQDQGTQQNVTEPSIQEHASSSAFGSVAETASTESLLPNRERSNLRKVQGKLQSLRPSQSGTEASSSSSPRPDTNTNPTSKSPQDTMTMGKRVRWASSWNSVKEKARKVSRGSESSTPASSERAQHELDTTFDERVTPGPPPTSPTSLQIRQRRRRNETDRMVSEAKSRHYWLGRFVTLTNILAYEDSFHGPDPATGFGMHGSFSRPVAQGRLDVESFRVKRVFIVLENMCVTEVAAMSLRRFREEYVARYGDRWMG